LALLFLIVVLGSIALPLTNGFVGEFLLLNGVFQYNFWAAFFAGLTVILGAVYMLRAYQQSMLGETNAATSSFKDLYNWEKIVLSIISVLIIVFGLFPNVLFQIISPMVESLLNNNL
jgi:NADH-quinone oxidoreductase subunit M